MTMLTCVSPIDGKVFAKREALSISKSQEVIETSRKSQPAWSQRPIEERIDLVLAGVAQMGRMNDDVVPELAKMMGRPSPVVQAGVSGGPLPAISFPALLG